MSDVQFLKPDYPPGLFAGTAEDYVRHRPPYPPTLRRDLLARTETSGHGRLLDLACGPGRVTLPLAASFREVWAIDAEPEMIAAAQRISAERGTSNVRWLTGRAEELDAPAAHFDLITIAEAFHRLDQRVIMEKSFGWLRPGGYIALLGSYALLGTAPWKHTLSDLVQRWTGADVQTVAPGEPGSNRGPAHDEQVLRASGFAGVSTLAFVEVHDWTIDAVIGFLFSTSFCSRRVLGAKADAFAVEMRAALTAHAPTGILYDRVRFGYTVGRKPG